MRVGDTAWVFDENRRVYADPKPGDIWPRGGPIYREHFRSVTVVGETRVSWLIDHYETAREGRIETRVNKKDHTYAKWGGGRGRLYTSQAEVDDACFVHDERSRIASAVQQCPEAGVLRTVKALVQAWVRQP